MSTEFDADVIVIGSGVLGSLTAFELAKQGKSVIILEAGERIPRWKILENYRNSSKKANYNSPYPNEPWAHHSYDEQYIENTGSFDFRPGMLKLVGGTTWHWAAACWRYLPNDMKIKSLYGVGRDWPLEYNDLEPYYVKAEEALGVCGNDSDDQSGQNGTSFPPRSKPYPMLPEGETYLFQRLKARLTPAGYHFIHEPNGRATKPYDGRPACSGNNNCMPVCPIGAMYSGEQHAQHVENAGAKLITDATAYRLDKGENQKITAVHYRTSHGNNVRLTAKYFVVAAHGLETPKLLLLSNVANSSDQVGRNLMDHTGMGLQFLADEPLWPGRGAVQQGGIFNWRDGEFRKRHSAIKHAVSNNVPNMSIAQRLISQGYLGSKLDAELRHQAARWVDISTVFEILPHATNRVSPSHTRKDALGIPMLQVHYEVDDYVKAAKSIVTQDYRQFVALMGGTVVEDNTGWQNRDHLMGSVIMGENALDSVVNHECRTYDHPNLFLATTGVIPASGVINPTLTGAALSIRLSEIIAREI